MPFSTDDLAARQPRQSPADESALTGRTEPDPDKPIRFTLRELLIAVTVIGVLLGILRAAGIFGALFAFLATAVFTGGVYPTLKRDDLRAQQAMFDFLWGVGMPLICLVFDPFVFKESADFELPGMGANLSSAKVSDYGFIAYAFIGGQMIVMTAWLILGGRSGHLTPFFGGFLFSGLLFAALVGLLLVIPAIIGVMFFGTGLLGLTPLVTTFAYARQCGRALAGIRRSVALGTLLPMATVGFIVSIVMPFFSGLAVLIAMRGPGSLAGILQW